MASPASYALSFRLLVAFLLLLSVASGGSGGAEPAPATVTAAAGPPSMRCETRHLRQCYNGPEVLRLKLIAIASILIASVIGVCLPLLTTAVPALRPDGDPFVIVKAFASGVILATGFMHVLPDSFDDLRSPCLPAKPWRAFPFTAFIAMFSAVVTLMLDSFAMAFHSRRRQDRVEVVDGTAIAPVLPAATHEGHGRCVPAHEPLPMSKDEEAETALSRNRVIAQVLETGIVVHSVVIGLSMGASQSSCTIRPLVAALCFHQLFEGMGLGGCILQAEYGTKMRAVLVFFFSTTTPVGIALGIAVSHVYSENSPTSLIVIGVLNASSAGLLIYMALVDLLAADFLGPKLQASVGLQVKSYAAVLLGLGGMSLMAKWA